MTKAEIVVAWAEAIVVGRWHYLELKRCLSTCLGGADPADHERADLLIAVLDECDRVARAVETGRW